MKKITLFAFALFATGVTFAQASLEGYALGNQSNSPLDECSYNFTGDALTLANAVTDHGPFVVANDFLVEPGSSINLESAEFLLLPLAGVVTDIATALIYVYEDSGAGPGTLVSTTTLTETGNTQHPDVFATYTQWYVNYDLDTPILLENATAATKTYWLALTVTSASVQHIYWTGFVWDASMETQINYQSQDGGATYAPIVNANAPTESYDSEWTLNGDCAALSVSNNILSQVSIYPNPTSGILNLKMPASVEVKSAVMFDVLGKRVNVVYSNGTINTSSLSQGVYLLKVETTAGVLTQKVVKQ